MSRKPWLWLCAVTVTAGCVAVPVYRGASKPVAPAADALGDGLNDYTGIIHVHTAPYSSDADGTFEKAVRVANAQRLDYLWITEHNTLRGYETGREGRYGRTLVMIGEEISTADGHYLALNVPHHVSRYQPTHHVVAEVAKLGGLGIVAHPFWPRKQWTRWELAGIDGLEIYNVAHDAMEDSRLRLLAWSLLLPTEMTYQSLQDRPYDALRVWDEIGRHRRFIGIGGVDAHEIHVLWMTIAPYEVLFRMVRTHLKAPELTQEALIEALTQGHAYISLELQGNATGFTFVIAQDGERIGLMGDEFTWRPGMTLRAAAPSEGRLQLLRDGETVVDIVGQSFVYPADRPGVYRVEVERGGRPWIFSNPIYLRDPATPRAAEPPARQTRRRVPLPS